MTEEDPTDKILAFARHVGRDGDPPDDIARARGWIDEAGRPTEEGHKLLQAIEEQKADDAVYRLDP